MTAPKTLACNLDSNAVSVGCDALFGFVGFEPVSLADANRCLVEWGHKMGPIHRGNQGAISHALVHEGQAVAVTTASNLIAPVVGGGCQ